MKKATLAREALNDKALAEGQGFVEISGSSIEDRV
jgi:hypothetical protein